MTSSRVFRSYSLQRKFFGPTFVIGVAPLAAAVGGMVFSKVVALSDGPSGVGLLGAFVGLVGIVAAIGSLCVYAAVPAQYGGRARPPHRVALRSAILVALPGVVIVFGVMVFWVMPEDLQSAPAPSLYIWALLASITAVAQLVVPSVQSVYCSARTAAVTSAVGSLTTYGVASVVYTVSSSSGVIVALGIGSIAGLAYFSYREIKISASSTVPERVLAPVSPYRGLLKASLQFSAASVGQVASWMVLPVVVFAVVGSELAGLYKAALSIAVALVSVGNAWIAWDTYPKIVASIGDRGALAAVLKESGRRLGHYLAPLALVVQVAAPLELAALFSLQFVEASALLAIAVVGLFVRSLSGVNRFLLMARPERWRLTILDWIDGLALGLGMVVASLSHSLQGFALALVFSGLVTLSISEIALARMYYPTILRAFPRIGWVVTTALALPVLIWSLAPSFSVG